MDASPFAKTVAYSEKKAAMIDHDVSRYLVRSVLAGLYLSLICFLYWSLLTGLAASPFGKVVASLFFGVGLCIIVFTGAELFTSNALYMTAGSLSGRATISHAVRLWVLCYLGNLAGAVLFALLLVGAGVTDDMPTTHALFTGAAHKVEQSARIIFFKGILANWVVCLAVWVGLHMKEDLARITAIILVVFVFLYLGFEHSIANMGTFSVALLGHGTITVGDAIHNLIWSTLGNLVGGGGLVAAFYWFLDTDRRTERALA